MITIDKDKTIIDLSQIQKGERLHKQELLDFMFLIEKILQQYTFAGDDIMAANINHLTGQTAITIENIVSNTHPDDRCGHSSQFADMIVQTLNEYPEQRSLTDIRDTIFSVLSKSNLDQQLSKNYNVIEEHKRKIAEKYKNQTDSLDTIFPNGIYTRMGDGSLCGASVMMKSVIRGLLEMREDDNIETKLSKQYPVRDALDKIIIDIYDICIIEPQSNFEIVVNSIQAQSLVEEFNTLIVSMGGVGNIAKPSEYRGFKICVEKRLKETMEDEIYARFIPLPIPKYTGQSRVHRSLDRSPYKKIIMKQSQRERLEEELKQVIKVTEGEQIADPITETIIELEIKLIKELLELSAEPKPVLLLTIPLSSSLKDIQDFRNSLTALDNITNDYYILVNSSDIESSRVEILSVKDVDQITIDELQKKVLEKYWSKLKKDED